MVHASHLDAMVHVDTELPVVRPHELSDVGKRIGKMIATDLVSDGATLQMGQSFYYLKKCCKHFASSSKYRSFGIIFPNGTKISYTVIGLVVEG